MKYCPKCFRKYPPHVEKCADDGCSLVSPMDKDLVGEVLDERYTVLERIGKGGMGVVYRAEQHLIKRIVALKVLRREIVQDERAVKRFLNEARAIASLDSKHTVSLYDFGVTRDGLLYYTMELLKGRPLSRLIVDEAPIDHVRAAGLLLQACRSLDEAHEHNILHRDLKPENLFVTVKKGKEQLKVLDFGIAKLLGNAAGETVTQAGMIVGTPQYLSPEQARGNPVALPSDLYSLGIVFYEMLSGEPPFLGDTPMQTLWAHINYPLPSLRQKNPDVEVPRSIEAFLARALEKEPSDRFQSAASFADALRRSVEDHEASPETVSLSPLATTDQGLAQSWPEDQVVATAEGSETSDMGSAEGVEERGTALLGSRDSGAPSAVDERVQEEPPPEPPTDDGIPDVRATGPYSQTFPLPKRNVLGWVVGGLALVVIIAGVFVWAPWERGPSQETVLSTDAAPDASSPSLTAPEDVVVARAPGVPNAGTMRGLMGATGTQDASEHSEEPRTPDSVPAGPDTQPSRDVLEAPDLRSVDEDSAARAETSASPGEGDVVDTVQPEDAPPAGGTAAHLEAERALQEKADEERERLEAEQMAKKKAAAEAKAKKKAAAEEAKRREEATVFKSERLIAQAREEMGKGRYEQALGRLDLASDAGGAGTTIGKLRSECYAGIKKHEVKKLVVQARGALGRNDYDSCIGAAEKTIELDPGSSEAKRLLAECREQRELDGMKFD